jgi:hypothetical protein
MGKLCSSLTFNIGWPPRGKLQQRGTKIQITFTLILVQNKTKTAKK